MSDLQLILIGALAVPSVVAIAGAAFYRFGRSNERRAADAAGRTAEQQAARLLADAKRDAEADRARMVLH